jgi:uncharacterized protein YqhQ
MGQSSMTRVKRVYKLPSGPALSLRLSHFVVSSLYPDRSSLSYRAGSETYLAFAEAYFRIYMFFTFIKLCAADIIQLLHSYRQAEERCIYLVNKTDRLSVPLILVFPLFLGY